MSSAVDNRIVEMTFDNTKFEGRASQTISTVEKLKQSLNFKNIGDLSELSKKIDLSRIAAGVDNISSRFSAMGVVGFAVLQNLANAAIDYGKKIVNGMISPMKEGFKEYEVQMNAIQTVLANTESKGTTLSDVTASLDELNTYADKTIYNFTEMTRNIGTFTAAGVDLETSTSAIKGIANLAAVSGSNSQQASTAMYQLSQALSSGTVKLMDWNSVVNAGMGGQVFQDALKETARAHGVTIDTMIEQEGSFRETLQLGWLTSDVLLETLSKFTGDLTAEQLTSMGYTEEQIASIIRLGQTANDAATKVKTFTQLKDTLKEAIQSGWTKSWQLIIGDFVEARELFTSISDYLGGLIGTSSDARNKILEDWKRLGGRTAIIKGIRYAWQGLLSVAAPIKDAFKEIFPKEFITGGLLAKISIGFRDFAKGLKISGETADKIKRIFKGVFSIFSIAGDIVSNLVKTLFGLVGGLKFSSAGVLDFLAGIGDFLVGVRESTDVSAIFGTVIASLGSIFDLAKGSFGGFFVYVNDKLWALKTSLINTFSNLKIGESFTNFLASLKPQFVGISSAGKAGGAGIAIFKSKLDALKPYLTKYGDMFKNFFNNLVQGVKDITKNIKLDDVFKAIQSGAVVAVGLAIFKFIKSITDILNNVGEIGKSFKDLLGGISGILDETGNSLKTWQMSLKADILLTIAAAIAILAAALIALTFVDSTKLAIALGAITGLFANLATSMAVFNKFGAGGAAGGVAMIGMAVSVLMLTSALKELTELDANKMNTGIKGLFAVMAGVILASRLLAKNMGSSLAGIVVLMGFSSAVMKMVKVVYALSELNFEQLQKGVGALAVLITSIGLFARMLNGVKFSASTGVGLLIMVGSIYALTFAMERLQAMDPEKLKTGLAAVGALLVSLGTFTLLAGDAKGMISTAIGLTIIAGSMFLLQKVMEKFAEMSWGELARGLVGVGGAMAILVAGIKLLPKNILLQSLSLIAIAEALSRLRVVIEKMAEMTWSEIGRGLITLGGAMLILVVALNGMKGAIGGALALIVATAALHQLTLVLMMLGNLPIPVILTGLATMAALFTILGVAGYLLAPVVPVLIALGYAMMLMAGAIMLVGVGMGLFAAGLAALAVSGGAAAAVLVVAITSILGLVPLIIQTLIDAMIQFAKGIQTAAPEIGKAILALIRMVLDVIKEAIPDFLNTVDVVLKALIKLMRDTIPDFVEALLELLVTLVEEIAKKLPDFLQAGWDILLEFLRGIRDNIGEVVLVVSDIVVEFLNALALKLPEIIEAGYNLMLSFIEGMATSVDENMQPILDAIGRLATAIINGLVNGILNLADTVINTLKNLAQRAIDAFMGKVEAKSPSKVFMNIGGFIIQGLILGLQRTGKNVAPVMEDLANKSITAMDGIREAIFSLFDKELDVDPTIRPVLDLSNILEGTGLINDAFNKQINIKPSLSSASNIASGIDIGSQQINTTDKPSVEFNQYNYSPKALSRVEIYRQTRNQLLALKGVVNT